MSSRQSVKSRLGAVSALTLLLAAAMGPSLANAQTPATAPTGLSESVVAVVNTDIISSFDVMQRMRLLVITSGIQVTQENLPQVQQEALRSLVDERLQLQELRRVEREQHFTIVATDEDIDQEIAGIAQSNNTTADALLASLASQGVGPATFRSQVGAEVSWQRWIRGRYGTRVRIGEDQIRAMQTRLASDATRPRYQIGEIFIDNIRAGGAAQAASGANQLVAELQRGAPFQAVARQFSSAPSSANGGDAGWVSSTDLAPEVEQAISGLTAGQLSPPIVTRDGVYIILLRDRRAGGLAQMVQLKQAAIALAPDATPAQVEQARVQLETIRPHVTGCGDLESAAQAQGVTAGDLGEADVNDLAPAFRDAQGSLAIGQLSAPIRTNVGLHLIAVCSRRAAGAEAATHEQIEGRLMGQQLSMISRRYMRDLRTSASIETR